MMGSAWIRAYQATKRLPRAQAASILSLQAVGDGAGHDPEVAAATFEVVSGTCRAKPRVDGARPNDGTSYILNVDESRVVGIHVVGQYEVVAQLRV